MEESTSLCSNCQRPIAASNFVTHSLHCQRNLTKCGKCGEAVPRSALEEHELEFHSKINCTDCHMSIEKQHLETHKKTACRSRPQGCTFCELELPASEIHEHENYCGSRTKKCEDCGEYVMLKYEGLHLETNHGFLKLDDEPGPSATWIKNDLESGGSRPAKSNNNRKPQLNTGKFDNADEDEDEMPQLFANLMKVKKAVGTTPLYPGVAYPLSGGSQRTVSRSPPPYLDLEDNSPDLVALPCEFCEAMIPVDQLILHQSGCKHDTGPWDSKVAKMKKSVNESPKQVNYSVVINDEDADSGDSNVENKLLDDVDWKRQTQPAPFDIRRNAIDEGNVDIRRNELSEGHEASLRLDLDDEGIYLPCEFCGDGYPPSLLLEHQDVCDYNVANTKNVPEASPVWSDTQEGGSGRSKGPMDSLRSKKFDESNYNILASDLQFNNDARGKSNISNSYNDLRGNFTVASEWSDDSDSRPTSATGAIPKQKAGKLNISRKVNQEVQGTRPSSAVTSNHSRISSDRSIASNATGELSHQFRIRNNLKDLNDDDSSTK